MFISICLYLGSTAEGVPLSLCLSGLIDDLLSLLSSFISDFQKHQQIDSREEELFRNIDSSSNSNIDSSSSNSSGSGSVGSSKKRKNDDLSFSSSISPAAAAARGCPGVLQIDASAVRWAVRRSAGLLRHM